MKIDSDFINNIFNFKIKLTKEDDKIKLSKYEELIPMYDIYSQQIYPINKKNIHYRLIESHYRFINKEIHDWIKQLYIKNKNNLIFGRRFKNILMILDNYDISKLIETSYQVLYKYSPMLGLSVSICKRNSFHPFIFHLKPYYSKQELIKLGQNMDLITSGMDPEYLIDQEKHYNICKKVSNNDVSFDEIKLHHQYIYDSNIISWICFYSLTGSVIFNKYLRNIKIEKIRNRNRNNIIVNKNSLDQIYMIGLHKIVKTMKNAPGLKTDYYMYRFIWDDSFLHNLNVGDILFDKGLISTTRDPFYSPGLNGNFGLVLLKIQIPKNKKGLGLFIENFSIFPKEEEFLLAPYSKMKLLSKNNDFKYYHTNPDFEKIINKKYEFELIEIDYKQFYKENNFKQITDINIKYYNIEEIYIEGIDRINIIKQFIQKYSNNQKIYLNYKNNYYHFNYQWFDSTSTSSYEKLYYNKIQDGMLFFIYDEYGYPYLNIELGNIMMINYLNKFYFGNNTYEITNDMLDLIYHFGRIFNYKNISIYHEYKSFSQINMNKDAEIPHFFLSSNLFNNTLYSYLKYNTKYLGFSSFIDYEIGYWYLDDFFNKQINPDIIHKLPTEIKQNNITDNKSLFIFIIENYFYFYSKLIDLFDINIFKNTYVNFNVYEKLLADGLTDNFKSNLEYTNNEIQDPTFKLIFRQPFRRY